MTTRLLHPLVLVLALAAGCGSDHKAVDASVADSFGGANFGSPCVTAADCPGGLCAATLTGGVCTAPCTDSCPEGWSCLVRDNGGDLQSICMPQRFDYCTPCTEDAQCAGGVCVNLDGTSSCLAECPFHATCPTGYSCGTDPSGQHDGSYCIPLTGTCTCTVAEQNQVRTCTTTDASGTCRGLETCDADKGGWVNCSAAMAVAETCDGADNDCDGLIDEGVGGSPCANTIAGVGSCPGITRCNGVAGVSCEGKMPMVETCNYQDDDCDGMIDEGFAGLGDVCSAGIGACKRFGVTRCTSDGSATQCSVTAGAPIAEKCNGIDDDCDSSIDEDFPTLGSSCTVGVGVCTRTGNLVCNAAQTGTTCSVMPGSPTTEICNGLDDNCNGQIDEGWKNQTTGIYDQAFACGSCSNDCTVLYALPNASGACDLTTGPKCKMVCNANAYDLDSQVGNGCEFVLDLGAVYVAANGTGAVDDASCGQGPVGTQSGYHPCKTITQGIARAVALNRPRVLVANGIYAEAVTLANGRSVLGGYSPDTWQRDVANTTTYITGSATFAATNHDYAVLAQAITSATTFEGFVVEGPLNGKASGNSYAIYVSGSNALLAIKNNTVLAGRAGPGSAGGAGASGASGVDGVGRSSNPVAYDTAYADTTPCTSASNRSYTNGGARTCGSNAVGGGNGGGNQCAPDTTYTQFSGISGVNGGSGTGSLGGAAGVGGEGGWDMTLEMNGTACYIGTGSWHDYGYDGTPGGNGQHGPGVLGCTATGGSVVSGHWVGTSGAAGVAGGNGGGGGGGGAGGGARCLSCPENKDQLGGGGGGGAAGGCGGAGGGASTAGGGVFAIFVAGGTAPVITGNIIQRGQGGGGGTGGAAGSGGAGGLGGGGGILTSPQFCPGIGGRGGNGGAGGDGSGGGGACGGSSIGIYTSGVGTTLTYCNASDNNTITGGAAGTGGAGGYSIVHAGGAGTAGQLAGCSFN
ncbi:MAG: MopE-related protein [Acidobacteriota bacterium]